jgi:hypothetical protein
MFINIITTTGNLVMFINIIIIIIITTTTRNLVMFINIIIVTTTTRNLVMFINIIIITTTTTGDLHMFINSVVIVIIIIITGDSVMFIIVVVIVVVVVTTTGDLVIMFIIIAREAVEMFATKTTMITVIITMHIRATTIIDTMVFIIIIIIITIIIITIDNYIIEIIIGITIVFRKLSLATMDRAAFLLSMEETRSSRWPSDEFWWNIPSPFFESVAEGQTNLRREVHPLRLHRLCFILPTYKAAMAGAGDGLLALRRVKETKVGRIMERT